MEINILKPIQGIIIFLKICGLWPNHNKHYIPYMIYAIIFQFIFTFCYATFKCVNLFFLTEVNLITKTLFLCLGEIAFFIKVFNFHIYNKSIQQLLVNIKEFKFKNQMEKDVLKTRLQLYRNTIPHANLSGKEISNEILQMKTDFDKNIRQRDFQLMCERFREILNNQNNELPYCVRGECLEIVTSISKGVSKEWLRDFIEIEMKNVVEHSPVETHPFIVHFLTCGTLMKSVSLQKATRICADRPIIVLGLTDGEIKARCCVPQNFITEKFSAFLWLTTVADVFKAQISPPRGQNKNEVCNMKAKKISSVIFDEKLETAMQRASNFAMNNM